MATLNCKTCGMIHPVCDPCEGPSKPRTCVTHHHACDCREREFEKIRDAAIELLREIHANLQGADYLQLHPACRTLREAIGISVEELRGNHE
jgi:hypothetical protein